MTRDQIRSYAESHGRVISEDVMQGAGISYRQLGYWCDTGLLECSGVTGSGSQRTFAPIEVAVAEILGRLSRIGLAPNSDLARKAAEAVRRGESGVITEGPLSVFLA